MIFPYVMNSIIYDENLYVLKKLPSDSIHLVYIDVPFNTGKEMTKTSIQTTASPFGDRVGFGGKKYETKQLSKVSFGDDFDDYMEFLKPRLEEIYRVLSPTGSLYVHFDYREVHYGKVLLDRIFGRDKFLNELIWAFDYGAKSKSKWPNKHQNILVYVKDKNNYTFNTKDIDRIPYMSPGLVSPDKVAIGKLPTDVWWMSIVGTNSYEKTDYPTQKPVKLLERIIRASSNPDDIVLDCFAGSGTTGEAAGMLHRRFIMVDNNEEAFKTMQVRLAKYNPAFYHPHEK